MVVPEHWRGEKDRLREELGLKESSEEKREAESILGSEYVWY